MDRAQRDFDAHVPSGVRLTPKAAWRKQESSSRHTDRPRAAPARRFSWSLAKLGLALYLSADVPEAEGG